MHGKTTPLLCLLLAASASGAAAQEEVPFLRPAYRGAPASFSQACRPLAWASLGHVQLSEERGALVHPGVSVRGRVECDGWRLSARLRYVSPNRAGPEYGELRVRLERSLSLRHLSLVLQTESHSLEGRDAVLGGLGLDVPGALVRDLGEPRLRFLFGEEGFRPEVDVRIDGARLKELLTRIF